MSSKLKPTFLIIGGRRCGSNWLQQSLMEHPEIFVPPGRPGVEGFDDKAESQYDDELAVGLVNAAWLTQPGTSEELSARYPDAKIIAILRSPIDRAYSWYWQCLKQGDHIYQQEISFAEAMAKDETIIEEGYYYKYLKKYLDLFDRENALVLRFDLLRQDSAQYLKQVYTFLGVDGDFVPAILNEKVNYSTSLKSRRLHQFLRQAKAIVLKLTGKNLWLIHRLENSSLVSRIRRMNEKSFPKLSDAARQELADIYRDDVHQLSNLLGRDFSDWLK